MKKHKGLIIAGVVLAALAAFCLWYTLVPKSWADIIGTDQTDSISFSGSVLYDVSEEVKEYGSYHLGVPNKHPAAQAIASALEGHEYRASLSNLSPISRDRIEVPGADALQFYLRIQGGLFNMVTIYSNGQVVTGGITSRLEGCRSYQTETDLFQQVFDILREYGISE